MNEKYILAAMCLSIDAKHFMKGTLINNIDPAQKLSDLGLHCQI